MSRLPFRSFLIGTLFFVTAMPASAQYRRQVEAPTPPWAVTGSIGGLLAFAETMNPIETPDPEDPRRGLRETGTSPWVSLELRYGRGIAIYGVVSAALAGDVELSGRHPITGAALNGTEDGGLLASYSVGASFTPLRDVAGLRVDIGPAWLDLGEGGSYVALRGSVAAKFLEIGESGGVLIAWDGLFAGGQHDRDGIEYQIRGGRMHALRAGYEYAF